MLKAFILSIALLRASAAPQLDIFGNSGIYFKEESNSPTDKISATKERKGNQISSLYESPSEASYGLPTLYDAPSESNIEISALYLTPDEEGSHISSVFRRPDPSGPPVFPDFDLPLPDEDPSSSAASEAVLPHESDSSQNPEIENSFETKLSAGLNSHPNEDKYSNKSPMSENDSVFVNEEMLEVDESKGSGDDKSLEGVSSHIDENNLLILNKQDLVGGNPEESERDLDIAFQASDGKNADTSLVSQPLSDEDEDELPFLDEKYPSYSDGSFDLLKVKGEDYQQASPSNKNDPSYEDLEGSEGANAVFAHVIPKEFSDDEDGQEVMQDDLFDEFFDGSSSDSAKVKFSPGNLFEKDSSLNLKQNSAKMTMAMPYSFDWGVRDAQSGVLYSHAERNNGQITQGEYSVLLPDGRLQIVQFWDDGNGYNAKIIYKKMTEL